MRPQSGGMSGGAELARLAPSSWSAFGLGGCSCASGLSLRPAERRRTAAAATSTSRPARRATTRATLTIPSFRTKATCTHSNACKINSSFAAALGRCARLVALLALLACLAASRCLAAGQPSLVSAAASSYLLYSGGGGGARPEAPELERLLKDANHSHASEAIDLGLANEVWRRWRAQTESYARERAHLVRPQLEQLLGRARVSSACSWSLLQTLERLAKLDDWAVRMYNSFGQFPAAGFFEGTHTSMGSYQQCVEVAHNELIGRPQYCTFQFQPVIPKRPRYHNILKTIDELANFTSEHDIFHSIAGKAHYFYYTKLRLATCLPTKCEKADLDRIGEQIALNTLLQFQGVQCLERSGGFQPDGAQIFALSVLALMASVALLGTLVHLFDLRALLRRTESGAELAAGRLSSAPFEQAISLHQQLSVASSAAAGRKPNGICMLPAPATASSTGANRRRLLLLDVLDVLMHFSVLRNGRKLFDTSTSRRGSLAADMSESAPVGAPEARSAYSSEAASSASGSSSSVNNSAAAAAGEAASSAAAAAVGKLNDISCVHGLRFWTISWIILGHTMQYTEWAGFGRAYQVEQNITSFLLHPLLNATFSVDTFFLISGLLTTYVTWSITRGQLWRFNKFAFLISRYLRLMPQVLIVILLFIAFPLAGDGPYWRGIVQKESDNCKRNWWVSALFLQSFYRSDQICNLVTWWLSIEMFYHFVSIIVILALLHSARRGTMAALALGGGLTLISCYLHYANSYPPNMLPTLLQRYEIWDSIVLKYFWTPYPHAPSYFVGLMLGYALYTRSIGRLSARQVRLGWLAFAASYLCVLFGTYHWNNNAPYSRLAATTYYNSAQLLWSLATGWAILACALGHGGWLNEFLSSPVFVPLGRATYMTYLSHMLIVMAYPAKQNLLIEPSYIVFLYIFISNLCLSYMLGITLTLVYESPILHLQKLLVTGMAQKFNAQEPATAKLASRHRRNKCRGDEESAICESLYMQQPNDEQRKSKLGVSQCDKPQAPAAN